MESNHATSESPAVPSVSPQQPIRRAAEEIDRAAIGITAVLDAEGRLLATVTDGDIRRAMLDGAELDAPIETLIERKRGAAYAKPITAHADASDDDLAALMRTHGVRQIPILDRSGRPLRIATLESLTVARPHMRAPLASAAARAPGPPTAVIMAGGRGVRLRPLTEHTPKPMLDVGGRPLLEHTVERLRDAGVRRILISTGYLADRIHDHFGSGERHDVEIEYIHETEPLGTAGCLARIDPTPTGRVLVLNGDILTSVDFDALRAFHDEHEAAMTVAVRRHRIAVPYGVADCDGVDIRGLTEKPTYSVFVNAGIYLMDPALLRLIRTPGAFDMTELIAAARGAGQRLCAFPIREYWLDIGRPDDYERAQREAPAIVARAGDIPIRRAS